LLHGPWDLPFVVLACLVEDPALEIIERFGKICGKISRLS
jgi:hypothetical protein